MHWVRPLGSSIQDGLPVKAQIKSMAKIQPFREEGGQEKSDRTERKRLVMEKNSEMEGERKKSLKKEEKKQAEHPC